MHTLLEIKCILEPTSCYLYQDSQMKERRADPAAVGGAEAEAAAEALLQAEVVLEEAVGAEDLPAAVVASAAAGVPAGSVEAGAGDAGLPVASAEVVVVVDSK
jgi:hypothetical protein